MITTAYGMLGHFHGSPSAFQVSLFAMGAVLAISTVEAVASSGFRRRPRTHPEEVKLLGTAANIFSVLVSLGVVYVAGATLPGPFAWPVAPLLAAGVYVLAEGAELALAERIQARMFSEQEAESQE